MADRADPGAAPEGWTGLADKRTQVLLDIRISAEVASEGMAREVIRHVNDERKNAQLEMEDRIELWLESPSDVLRQAIGPHRAYIAVETLTSCWAEQTLVAPAHRASIKLDGQVLNIALRKCAAGT